MSKNLWKHHQQKIKEEKQDRIIAVVIIAVMFVALLVVAHYSLLKNGM